MRSTVQQYADNSFEMIKKGLYLMSCLSKITIIYPLFYEPTFKELKIFAMILNTWDFFKVQTRILLLTLRMKN